MNRRTFARAAGLACLGTARLPRLRSARGARFRAFGGTLTAAIVDAAAAQDSHDPHRARTRIAREVAAAIHATLFRRDRLGRALPMLAESATASSDARRWSIALRPGIAFADGTPITAEAVVESLRRAVQVGGRLPASLAAARATGSNRVEIDAAVPAPDLPLRLADVGSAIVRLADGLPVGAGAFAPEAGPAAGVAGVLVANPRCPAGRPYLDRLIVADDRDAAAHFRKGQAQVIAAGDASAASIAADVGATVLLMLSPRLPPDLRARIAAAPDRKLLSEVFLGGRARPASTLLPPGSLGPLVSPATAGAPALGAPAGGVPTAGEPNPRPPRGGPATPLTLIALDGSADLRKIADRLVWDLRGAGVAATVGWRRPEAITSFADNDRWDLLLMEWVPTDSDPGFALESMTRHPAIGVDAAENELRALAAIADPAARTSAARAADDRVRAAGRIVPLVHPRRLLKVAPAVEGLSVGALGTVDWAEVGLPGPT